MSQAPRGHLAKYIGLIFIGLSLAFISGEIALRLSYSDQSKYSEVVTFKECDRFRKSYGKPNSDFIYYGPLGAKKEYETHGHTNSIGFYDREYALKKPPNTFRIVVTGDSFVEALQVPLQKNFHKVLEKMLNEKYPGKTFEVIGLGRSGNGARKNFQFLRELGIKYGPDIVISEFLPGNDVRDDSAVLESMYKNQLKELAEISLSYKPRVFHPEWPLFRHSRMIRLLGQSILNLEFKFKRKQLPDQEQIPIDLFVYAAEYDRTWKDAWQGTLDQIHQAKSFAEEHHSRFVLVNFGENFKVRKKSFDLYLKSNPAMKHYNWDFDHPDKIIRSFCRNENIMLLELEPLFQAEFRRANQWPYFKYDGHWSETGHQFVAQMLLKFLEEQHLLGK